jgi:nucleoid-associated protein YgaU
MKLEKAFLQVLGGRNADKIIPVLFNPTEYSFDRSNAYKATSVPGLGTPLIQFVNGEADQLSLELFLDDFTDSPGAQTSGGTKSVEERIAEIAGLLDIDRDLHAPPPVKFSWARLHFTGVIEKLGRKVTMFRPDGTPARATLSLTFKEYRPLAKQLQEPRRESADKSKRRVMVGLDTLWALAAREYDSPAEWKRIAEANDLDNPREVSAGDWILLPPIENEDGPRDTV